MFVGQIARHISSRVKGGGKAHKEVADSAYHKVCMSAWPAGDCLLFELGALLCLMCSEAKHSE